MSKTRVLMGRGQGIKRGIIAGGTTLAVLGASLAVASGPVSAAPGDPDTAFNQAVAASGGLDATAGASALQSDGKIVVVGSFTAVGDLNPVNRLARFNGDGTPDNEFNSKVSLTGGLGDVVSSVALQSDGKILVAGNFVTAGGIANVLRLARFNSDGTPDGDFNSKISDSVGGLGGSVSSVAVQQDGRIVVAGNFTKVGATNGVNRLAGFNSDGSPDSDFNSKVSASGGLDQSVNGMAIQPDGKIVLSGSFTNAGGLAGVNRLARFNSDGSPDVAFNTTVKDSQGVGGATRGFALQPDGKILIGGTFTSAGGVVNVNRLARFESDGSLDATFATNMVNSGGFDNIVYGIRVQPDGKVLVSGSFTNAGGESNVLRLARLEKDGKPDVAFNKVIATTGGLDGDGRSLALQSNGMVVVSGNFTTAGGLSGVNRLARFDTKAVTPPTPPKPDPSGKKSQSLKAGAAPQKIKFRGTTVINKRNAKTKQGRPLTAKARVTLHRGEVTCFRLARGKQRKLTIRTTGKCNLRVAVTYTAPGNASYKPFKQVKTYRAKR